MKKLLVKFLMLTALTFAVTAATEAQVVIKVRPAAPVLRPRPIAPSPAHVWIEGEYVVRGGQYVYSEGYWAKPPRPRAVWVPGHWKHRRGGWFWVPGHWRR
ncbi:MAG: YXWGXW repeat-containing protein [Bacteroidetes bacterium]|nr:YXWGXW repeat-containing protein [Bacteroidota bacterium]